MEISQDSIKKAPLETKTKLANDLMRLLQVREKNEAMSKDWLLFMVTSRFQNLRPGEIYEAFKLALSRDILDEDGKGMDIFPELSINTTGKVLNAYLKWKNENSVYQLAKKNLKALSQKPQVTEAEIMQIREDFLKMVFDELREKKFSDSCWILFPDVKNKITTSLEVQQRLFRIQKNKFLKSRPSSFDFLSGGKRSVQNICRSIVASNFLKKHLKDFETFKNIINEQP